MWSLLISEGLPEPSESHFQLSEQAFLESIIHEIVFGGRCPGTNPPVKIKAIFVM